MIQLDQNTGYRYVWVCRYNLRSENVSGGGAAQAALSLEAKYRIRYPCGEEKVVCSAMNHKEYQYLAAKADLLGGDCFSLIAR